MPSAPVFAFHAIWFTTSVMSPSSVTIGLVSLSVDTCTLQPGLASTDTDGIGVSGGVGKLMAIPVTLLDSSFGTRNESFTVPPFGADGGSTVTWADAGAASA